MRPGIIGKKVGMTQIFDENGYTVPVTVIDTTDCHVTQVKTKDKDGYTAIQVSYGQKKPQNITKSQAGHHKKAEVKAGLRNREIRFSDKEDLTQLKNGAKLNVAMFAKGDKVDVVGVTRGRGFSGVMKRLGYSGKDATHGTSKYFRHGGSNGTNTFPGRVLKNKGMPGQYGNARCTTQNLVVVDVQPDSNLLLLKGAVPGPKESYVMVRTTIKRPTPTGRALTA